MRCTRTDIYKTAVSIALTAVLFCAPAHAAWLREEGTWFVADSISTYRTNHFIDNAGRSRQQPTFTKWEWNGYAEYGLRDDVTLGTNLFFHRLSADYAHYTPTSPVAQTGNDSNYGLADSEFFLRKRLWRGEFLGRDTVFSIQPLIKLPSWYYEGGNPRGGTDNFDAELRLLVGYHFTFLEREHFSAVSIAYRKRMGDWRDQVKSEATIGLNLTDRIMFLMQNFTTQRVERSYHSINSSATVNDYDLVKTQLSIVYKLNERTHIQLGGFEHIQARNTGDGGGFLLSLWKEF